MRMIQTKDYEAMSAAAARLIAAQITLKPNCVLGLATGSSPVGIYRNLIAWNKAGALDFSQVRSVNLDEYAGLTPDHEQSYAHFMRYNLFDHVNIDLNHTHVPSGIHGDGECERYDQLIASLGGIDLQLLGLGVNGHIGFNEPDDHFSLGTHKVTLTDSTRQANKRFFASIDEVPTHAYTMGVRDILQARRVVMVASGANKARAVKEAFFGPVTPQVPASILQYHPDFILVADAEALSEL